MTETDWSTVGALFGLTVFAIMVIHWWLNDDGEG